MIFRRCRSLPNRPNKKNESLPPPQVLGFTLAGGIDRAAAKLWGIPDDELRAIQDALAEMSPRETASQTQDESEDE